MQGDRDEIVPPLPWQIENGHIRKSESDGNKGVEYHARQRPYTETLVWLFRNDKITQSQFHSGRRFYVLWYYGGVSAKPAISRYGEMRGGAEAGASENLQREYHFAREAIRGTKPKEIAFNVCCLGQGSGKNLIHLKSALDDLTGHFKDRDRSESDHKTSHSK